MPSKITVFISYSAGVSSRTRSLVRELVSRTDKPVILDAWRNLKLRLKDLETASAKFSEAPARRSFSLGADICATTRTLWLAIYTVADLYRPALTPKVISSLTRAFHSAFSISESIKTGFAAHEFTSTEQDSIKQRIREAIAARRDSMNALKRNEPLHEFSSVGITGKSNFGESMFARAKTVEVAATKKTAPRAKFGDIAPRPVTFGGVTRDERKAAPPHATKAQAVAGKLRNPSTRSRDVARTRPAPAAG